MMIKFRPTVMVPILLLSGCVGAIDPNNVPAGNVPPGNVPPGNVPAGNVPPGNVPPGNVPADNVPPGNIPAGNVPPGSAATACKPGVGPSPGHSPLRRLSSQEYNNTVRDLLGDTTRPARDFPEETRVHGFQNNASVATVSDTLIADYLDAAQALAAKAVLSLGTISRCDPAAAGEDVCAKGFIDSFGKRAWRRPLDSVETASLFSLYGKGKQNGGYANGVGLVIQSLLQSAPFLYRVEIGVPAMVGGGVEPLSPWEMASRLSYLIWGSMPDDALFSAAEAGQLGRPEQIAEQARRMIKDPRARAMALDFHGQWLGFEKIRTVEKDPKMFPAFVSTIPALLFAETTKFIDHTLWDGDGRWETLLAAPFTFANASLAKFYGVNGPTGNEFEKIALDPAVRSGILTQASIMATQANSSQTSPVLRGKFVREQFLCQEPPPPPPDIEVKAPDIDPTLTTRERFAQHAVNPVCRSCHKLMDPIGLTLESYDAVGRFRTTENGKSLDVSGEVAASDIPGQIVGGAELGRKLAASAQVRGCVATQWLRFAMGRMEAESDACTLDRLKTWLGVASSKFPEFLVELTQTDGFLYRSAGGSL